MTLNKAKQLHSGDEVFWVDPDEGLCSHKIKITEIEVRGNIICLTGTDTETGNLTYLECFPNELSQF